MEGLLDELDFSLDNDSKAGAQAGPRPLLCDKRQQSCLEPAVRNGTRGDHLASAGARVEPKPCNVSRQAHGWEVCADCCVETRGGKTLTEYFVVRKLCDPIAAIKALEGPQQVTLKLPEGIELDNLGLAVLVEDSKTMETIEAAVFDLP